MSLQTYFCNTYAPLPCDHDLGAVCIGPHASLNEALAASKIQTGIVEFDAITHSPVRVHKVEGFESRL